MRSLTEVLSDRPAILWLPDRTGRPVQGPSSHALREGAQRAEATCSVRRAEVAARQAVRDQQGDGVPVSSAEAGGPGFSNRLRSHCGRQANLMSEIEFRSLTPERSSDLATFSAQHGKFGYCSCMRWRMTSTAYQRSTKEERIAELNRLLCSGTPIGVLAYSDGEPVGWCSVAPRETYGALERYRALPRIDDQPVWSVVCFFVDRRVRKTGLMLGLLRAAVDYAFSQGAGIVEGYPVEQDARLYRYMGGVEMLQSAGFRDATPCGQSRRVMRIEASALHSDKGL